MADRGERELGIRMEVDSAREQESDRESEMAERDVEEHDDRSERESVRDENEEEDTIDGAICRIKRQVSVISNAVSQESKGKVTFNRADQQTVKGALETMQGGLIEVLLKQLALERENGKLREELGEEKRRRMEHEVRRKEEERRVKHLEQQISEGAARKKGGNAVQMATGVVSRSRMQETKSDSGSGSESENETRRQVAKATYAQVSGRTKNESRMTRVNESAKGGRKENVGMEREKGDEREGDTIRGRVVQAGDEGWKTPPKRRQGDGAFILTGLGPAKGKELMGKLARELQATEIGGPPQGARVTKEGKVIIVPRDKEQARVMGEKLGKMRGLDVKRKEEREPLLIITGMEAGLTEDCIREGLERENEELAGMGKEFKIWKRMPCSNPWKENVVVRVGNERFKRVVKKGKIDYGCMRLYAEEFLDVAMCHRCCRFGHVQKHCRENVACLRCGGGHDARECKEERKACINCYRMTGRKEAHAARDQECPAFKKAADAWRRGIKYD